MTDESSTEQEIVMRFRSRLLEDRLEGRHRSLAAYLAESPRAHWPHVAREWIEDAEEVTTDPEPDPGHASDGVESDFGPYRLVAELGRGGQGVVYHAEDTRLGRPVALKVLEGLRGAEGEGVRRLRREAEAASRLEDPGICTVYEAGVVNGTPFIAMQYLEGETLAELISTAREVSASAAVTAVRIPTDLDPDAETEPEGGSGTSGTRRHRRDVRRVVELVMTVARALHEAHAVGVLHRDVKPANLMVSPSGSPVVLDFGLARVEDDAWTMLTRSGSVIGTPAYMSPEQISGEGAWLDARTDVYSLGVVLFECLTCRHPHVGASREALYQSIMRGEPPDVCSLNPAVPRDLGAVVAKALERDRDRRYETALDFAEDLRRNRDVEPVHARRVTRRMRLARWVRRNPGVAACLTVVLLLLVAALISAVALLASERERTEALEREAEAFNRFGRIADPALLRNLSDQARQLWPRRARRVPDMDAWLLQARSLRGRFDSRMADLAALRRRALPPRPEDAVEAERLRMKWYPEIMQHLKVLDGVLADIAADRDHAPEGKRAFYEERSAKRRAELAALLEDSRVRRRLVWRFRDREVRQEHRALSELERQREAFTALFCRVEERRALAASIAARSIEACRDDWDRCLSSLESSERYGHLAMEPLVGLAPLGVDAESGLWEFWHLGSGERPGWSGTPLGGKAEIDADSGIVFVLIPGGSFLMGAQAQNPSAPNFDPQAREVEGPTHEVTLDPFLLAKHETTQGQWVRVAGTNPAYYQAGREWEGNLISLRNPVEKLSWAQASEFAHQLDLQLPTEAQWEYAARGGTSGPWWFGSDRASLVKANIADARAGRAGIRLFEPDLDDGHAVHARVGAFPPNPFGLHEVIGNVFEWCRDTEEDYTEPPIGADGLRASSGPSGHVVRGGSFGYLAILARVTSRVNGGTDSGGDDLGLRLARRIRP